mmetsp:Transcript_72459/g.206305  ORF Transcript_72459/g.206305 Transcript_72459/m.206305 type:complete len:229 (+) Transcript_72459:141-827(+)
MGPKVSSSIAGESMPTRTTVGATYRSFSSTSPPHTTLPPWFLSMPLIRSTWLAPTIRPKCADFWASPSKNLSSQLLAASQNSSTTSRWQSTKSGEMHCWPAFMHRAQQVRLAAISMLADLSTKTGFLPPSSRVHGVKCFAAPSATTLPTVGEPVKKILSHRCSRSAAVQWRSPFMVVPTTCTTSGSMYSLTRSACSREHALETLHGLSTTVLPAAMAPITGISERQNG